MLFLLSWLCDGSGGLCFLTPLVGERRENQVQFHDIIYLYLNEKVRNFRKAENAINMFTLSTNKACKAKAQAYYELIVSRYCEAGPTIWRLDIKGPGWLGVPLEKTHIF